MSNTQEDLEIRTSSPNKEWAMADDEMSPFLLGRYNSLELRWLLWTSDFDGYSQFDIAGVDPISTYLSSPTTQHHSEYLGNLVMEYDGDPTFKAASIDRYNSVIQDAEDFERRMNEMADTNVKLVLFGSIHSLPSGAEILKVLLYWTISFGRLRPGTLRIAS